MGGCENIDEFVKERLQAEPMGTAQPQMVLGAVLKLNPRTKRFEKIGSLGTLCADTKHREEVLRALAKVETLEHPFDRKTHGRYQGVRNANATGFLGVVFPIVAAVKSSKSRVQIDEINTHYLTDDYLVDIIITGKWKPKHPSLRDFYVITEILLTRGVQARRQNKVGGGAAARIDVPGIVGAGVEAGWTYSQSSDGSLDISGVTEDGQEKPFAIAFRTAHIRYRNDGSVDALRLGVRRGEDDGHVVGRFGETDEEDLAGEFPFDVGDNDEADRGTQCLSYSFWNHDLVLAMRVPLLLLCVFVMSLLIALWVPSV